MHAAGNSRQDDVVDGASEGVLDLPEDLERPLRGGEAAIGTDLAIEGPSGRRAHPGDDAKGIRGRRRGLREDPRLLHDVGEALDRV
jgi:hypothetical protein